VAWVLWGGWYPIVIAQQQGLFEKHGVQVEPVFYQIYSDVPSDFASGKVDGGLFALFDLLPLESHQQSTSAETLDRIVMITDSSEGADAVLGGPGIASVADLKGHRLGVKIGSYAEVMIAQMLATNGLTSGDVQLVNVEPEHALNALASGSVDAVHSYEPYVSQTVAKGYRIIFSSADTPGLIPNVLAFRSGVLRDRPDDVRAFIAAWFEAQAYWLANPEAGNALIATATGQKPEDVSLQGIKIRSLADNLKAFQPGQDSNSIYYNAQLNLNFLIQSGAVSSAPDVNKLLDPSFLK
jgi:NitT/TauT family transport system substrate-binding protein